MYPGISVSDAQLIMLYFVNNSVSGIPTSREEQFGKRREHLHGIKIQATLMLFRMACCFVQISLLPHVSEAD